MLTWERESWEGSGNLRLAVLLGDDVDLAELQEGMADAAAGALVEVGGPDGLVAAATVDLRAANTTVSMPTFIPPQTRTNELHPGPSTHTQLQTVLYILYMPGTGRT